MEKRGRGWGLRGRGSGADNIHQGLSFLTSSPGSFRWRRVWFFFHAFLKFLLLSVDLRRGGSRGRVQGVRTPPPPEMTCGFLIQLVFCKKILCGLLVLK